MCHAKFTSDTSIANEFRIFFLKLLPMIVELSNITFYMAKLELAPKIYT